MKKKQILSGLACTLIGVGILAGATGCSNQTGADYETASADTGVEDKVLNFGTTDYWYYDGVNPHESYSGWFTVRYGIGETLVKISETSTLEPWLAESWNNTDEKTWVINIREGVTFHNGKKVDAASVKDCLQHLIDHHDRAPADLKIDSMEANGQTLTVKTKEPNPAFMNYLADPYGAIIDVSEKIDGETNVVGTGPYSLERATEEDVVVHAYMDYWGEKPKIGTVNVISIKDSDTLMMSLQNGEVDVAQGVNSSNLEQLRKDGSFEIYYVDTSRTFDVFYNQDNEALKDLKVRKAIASAIDKEKIVEVLLAGNGQPAVGLFPSSYTFGDSTVHTEGYDLEKARQLLKEAGWEDTDNDGYVDKDGKKLKLTWLTYTSTPELPQIVENAQYTLKQIGIEVDINAPENHTDFLKAKDFDLFLTSVVSAPTGDPEYIFTTFFTEGTDYDVTGWKNDQFDNLLKELRTEFDEGKRSEITTQLQQILLDENVLTFICHLRTSLVTSKSVSGLKPHTSDYYEFTSEMDINK